MPNKKKKKGKKKIDRFNKNGQLRQNLIKNANNCKNGNEKIYVKSCTNDYISLIGGKYRGNKNKMYSIKM